MRNVWNTNSCQKSLLVFVLRDCWSKNKFNQQLISKQIINRVKKDFFSKQQKLLTSLVCFPFERHYFFPLHCYNEKVFFVSLLPILRTTRCINWDEMTAFICKESYVIFNITKHMRRNIVFVWKIGQDYILNLHWSHDRLYNYLIM